MEIPFNKKLSVLLSENNNIKGHVSALVKGGKVICYAECSLGGTPLNFNRGRSCHSELALFKIHKNFKKRKISRYKIWNIRISKDGKILNAKPCLECQKNLLKLGIKTIIFSNEDGKFIKNKLNNISCKKSSGFLF